MARPHRRAAVLRIWVVATVLALAAGVVACDGDEGSIGPIGPVGAEGEDRGVPGSGTIISEPRTVRDFRAITFASEGVVIVTTGGEAALTVEADDNLLEFLETETSNGRLDIATHDGQDIAPTVAPTFTVTVPELDAVELAGVGSVTVDTVTGERLELTLSGVGDLTIDAVDVETLVVNARGVGSLTVSGTAQRQEVSVEGVTEYMASDLESETASIEASGNGHAVIWVSDDLAISASGTASVEYYGAPQIDQQLADLASVVPWGTKDE